jgi:hypothetical protein
MRRVLISNTARNHTFKIEQRGIGLPGPPRSAGLLRESARACKPPQVICGSRCSEPLCAFASSPTRSNIAFILESYRVK